MSKRQLFCVKSSIRPHPTRACTHARTHAHAHTRTHNSVLFLRGACWLQFIFIKRSCPWGSHRFSGKWDHDARELCVGPAREHSSGAFDKWPCHQESERPSRSPRFPEPARAHPRLLRPRCRRRLRMGPFAVRRCRINCDEGFFVSNPPDPPCGIELVFPASVRAGLQAGRAGVRPGSPRAGCAPHLLSDIQEACSGFRSLGSVL